jgi:hypothetical protein
VVVVEWGDGLLDGVNDSVLRIVLVRPGSDATTDDEDTPIEPRTVELWRSGPRWAGAPPLLG